MRSILISTYPLPTIWSGKTSAAPRTPRSTPAISWLTRWMSSSLEPKTLTATGSRTPVESISIRLAIGWVKLLPQPGICKAVLISSTRSVFVFFQSRSRSANGLSSSARTDANSCRSRVTGG